MKRFLIIVFGVVFCFLSLFFIEVPNYVELNNLAIIEGIGIECFNKDYKIYLKEIIPKKGENGIEYEYRIYKSDKKESIKTSIKDLEDNVKKKLYYKEVKYLVTNCDNSKEIRNILEMRLDYIRHIKGNVFDYLSNLKEK